MIMFGNARSSSEDKDIIQAIQAGGIARQRQEMVLFQKFAYFVPSRPGKYRLNDEEAQDAYTEAFLAVVDNIVSGKFRGESSLKTYLSRIFRNKCVDQARRNATRRVEWTDEFPELPDQSKDFLRDLMGKEELRGLKLHLEALGERCRNLLMLSGQGYSPQEIAETMGFKTPRSASSQRYKCLERLKAMITSQTRVDP
ncbi:MAG: sigma-70 family RNA polymerase sigma factor [Bacteroidota bacterium]